ncbi:MAG: helix-turn-helix domain-containing protein [Phenylobacterium sp.]|uniref:GlxA family transcriptional regulator n=1 Tax=Phenylobacterium sp. TaxID=1871053 RepID=UPI003BB53A9B
MRIALLAYDQCLASELFALRDVLAMGDRISALRGGRRLEVSIVTASEREVCTAGGARIAANPPVPGIDLLVVPGFDLLDRDGIDLRLAALQPEIDLLRTISAGGVAVASICVGAFLLGAAGLLDERRATTAWLFGDELARRHPRARIDRDALLVEDGGVTTTGAFTASHDLALHLIDRRLGAAAARATRNIALIEGHVAGQGPFVDPSLLPGRATAFSARVETWLRERLGEPYSLTALADGLGASRRTLLRRYKAERGQPPLTFLQGERIEQAKLLLEQTALGVAEIAHRVGYEDVSAFRTLFGRRTGATPGSYRQRFQRRA